MPNDHDTNSAAMESWMFLAQGSALNVFQPFNHFSMTLPEQGICLKKPTADFHQLNGMQQPIKSLTQAHFVSDTPLDIPLPTTYEKSHYDIMSSNESMSNQHSPASYATKTSSANHDYFDTKTEAATLSTKIMKTQRVTKPANQKQVYVPRACKSCKAAHMACDADRPCLRCQRLGKGETCVDADRKKRGRRSAQERNDFLAHRSEIPISFKYGLKSASKSSQKNTIPAPHENKHKEDIDWQSAPKSETRCSNNMTGKKTMEADRSSGHHSQHSYSSSAAYVNYLSMPMNAQLSQHTKIVAYHPPPPPPPRYDCHPDSPRQYSFLESLSEKNLQH
ncbi:hypothetical protein INT43_006438 [Umbelopsis isabellina]|uniref:Zn(2)-C6 fungal-type domain-containing protein n=1 Tax=Mortierella isabellina TaxID=91625 RepID=A0A8H7PZR1_MORIS|nr:hypothetical protein INT43_006438 [Umbelopsis isabellina]